MVKRSFTEDLLMLLHESISVYVPLQAYSTGRPGFSISPSGNSIHILQRSWTSVKKLYLYRSVEGGLDNPIPRLGHLTQHCTDIYLLTHRRRQSPPPVQLAPHQILHAHPPSPEDNYSEEERFNLDVDEPDPDWNDWSLEVHPSPNSSGQEQSPLSFSGAEQAYMVTIKKASTLSWLLAPNLLIQMISMLG
ncbi:uncharacterized protein LOC113319236 [Papaver somniferum]|uniref:uncharacterized protein LOC113319236 n=1 Tax=Papaver somniferum TaxID=3469 RepID=UPI000E7038B7|nr:uncharacterized protein LOC113319236 [Papaver somniferum]